MTKILFFSSRKPVPARTEVVVTEDTGPCYQEVALPHNWRAWNEAKYIKEAIGKTERDRIQQLQYSWPNLYMATHRLALQLTSIFPGQDGNNLLAETVVKAFDQFDAKKTSRELDAGAQIAFMKELSLAARKVLQYTVLGEDEDGQRVHWSPFKIPMSEWIRRHNVVKVIFEPTTDYESMQTDAPKLLAHEILDTEDMLMISTRAAW